MLSKKLKKKNQRGVAMYLAVVVMAILLAMVFGLNAILIGQIKMNREMGYSVAAFYAAETGIETALYENEQEEDFGELEDDYPKSGSLDNGAEYEVLIIEGSIDPDVGCSQYANYCLESTGTFGQTKRAIQVER